MYTRLGVPPILVGKGIHKIYTTATYDVDTHWPWCNELSSKNNINVLLPLPSSLINYQIGNVGDGLGKSKTPWSPSSVGK